MNQELIFVDGDTRPLCPRCKSKGIERKMAKAGKGNSGTKSYKAYRCTLDGYYTLNHNEPIEDKKG